MSQLSSRSRESIIEADVVEENQGYLDLYDEVEESRPTLEDDVMEKGKREERKEESERKEERKGQRKEMGEETTIVRWEPVLENKANSDKPQILKKIKNKQKKERPAKSALKQPITSLPARKQKPQPIRSQDQQQPLQQTLKTLPPKPQAQLQKQPRKHKYRRKNYNFEDRLTKIAHIKQNKTSTSNVNILGQIIFLWDRHTIHERWANTEVIRFEIRDKSGAITVAIPYKLAVNKYRSLQIGMYIEIHKAQVKQKYPDDCCLLLNQKSAVFAVEPGRVRKSQLMDSERLSIRIRDMESLDLKSIGNILCIVLNKEEKQFLRSQKQGELCVCKLTVYDPIDRKTLTIKLWQQKTDIKFFTNAAVYILRGIQAKQFKDVREYHASKDFNWRILSQSPIHEWLREFYGERDRVLGVGGQKIGVGVQGVERRSVQEAVKRLDRIWVQEEAQKRKEEERMKKEVVQGRKMEQPDQKVFQKQQQFVETQVQPQSQQKIQSEPSPNKPQQPKPSFKPRILTSWSISPIKFLQIWLTTKTPLSFSTCPHCKTRISSPSSPSSSSPQCPQCNSPVLRNYSIKCEFYDGHESYLGEIYNLAGGKIFGDGDHARDIESVERDKAIARENLAAELVGDTVQALVVSTKEEIQEGVWLTGFYIVDILPFEEEPTEEICKESIKSLDSSINGRL